MNQAVFYFFYNLAHWSEFLDWLIVFLAESFPYLVIFFAIVYLLFFRKSVRDFFGVFFASGLAWFAAYILKILIKVPRPFEALSDVTSLFLESGYAFPSGHATFFSALAFAIFFRHKKAGSLFMLFALLIGVARIAAGVHFPADILGGFVLGGLVSYLVAYLIKKV